MNDQQSEKKDLNNLVGDNAIRFSKFENNINQATAKVKEDLTIWAEDGISQLSKGFERMTGSARESMAGASTTMKNDVGQGLNQYNAKAQEVADKFPGGFSKMAARYPWVSISIALAVGLLLGSLFKPRQLRQLLG